MWEVDRDATNSYMHPTQKPVALVDRALVNSSKRGNIILDPFMGSGTTLMACEATGRVCRGMDVDPKYVDVAVRRWTEHTGCSATLEATAATWDEVEDERAKS